MHKTSPLIKILKYVIYLKETQFPNEFYSILSIFILLGVEFSKFILLVYSGIPYVSTCTSKEMLNENIDVPDEVK